MRLGPVGPLALLGTAACAAYPGASASPGHGSPGEQTPMAQPDEFAPTELLSAQLTRAYWDQSLDAAVLLVFSRRIDPASVDPRYFSVIVDNGLRVIPDRALLAPASEEDEHRSVALSGAFTATGDERPIHVIVSGPVYSVAGDAVQRASATVEESDKPPYLVAAELLDPTSARCSGYGGMVRTYWSNVLNGVEDGDKARVELEVRSGGRIHPSGFDDHRSLPSGGEAVEDNVLDLCLSGSESPTVLHVARGAFADPEGRPTDPAVMALP